MSTPLEQLFESNRQFAQRGGYGHLFSHNIPPILPPEGQDEGFFSNFFKGTIAGLIDPLEFIPGVGEKLDEFYGDRGSGLDAKIGYGAGMLAGFLVPAGLSLKVGSKVLKWAGLVKKADAFTDLGMLRNLARGGIAGSVLGAGREAEDFPDRLENMATEALMFGVGDAAGHLLYRGISKAANSKVLPDHMKNFLIKQESKEIIDSKEEIETLARVLHGVDDVFTPATTGQDINKVNEIRAKVRAGIHDIGLDRLRDGNILIRKSIDTDASDLQGALNVASDKIDFRVVRRGPDEPADVLIAKKGQLDPRAVDQYLANMKDYGEGFIPGQLARWKGTDWYIIGPTGTPGSVKLRAYANRTKVHKLPIEDIEIHPYAVDFLGPTKVPNANSYWAGFIERYGDLPAVDTWHGKGFNWAFDEYVEAVEGKALYKIWKKRKDDNLLNKVHVEGEAAVRAAQNGYLVTTRWSTEKQKYLPALKDVFTGNSTRVFADQNLLNKWLKANPRELPDFFPKDLDPPLGMDDLGLSGVGVQVFSKAAANGFYVNKWVPFLSRVMPRYVYFREMLDAMAKTAPELYERTGLARSLDRLQTGITLSREQAMPWLIDGYSIGGVKKKSLRDIIGNGKRIRVDKEPAVVNLMQLAKSEWDNAIKAFDLKDSEVQVARELREFFNDFFDEVLVKSGEIDISAEDFLVDYFPHIWNAGSSGSDISAIIRRLEGQGKRVSSKAIEFIHEMRRTGQNTEYITNPFHVSLRYVRTAFAKKHLSEPFSEARESIMTLANAAKEANDDNLLNLAKSSTEYLTATYGNQPE
ncbi:MAG: hypothetical protein ACXABY_35445, partial [Candidatus Thorarchaeota archaeon]